MTEALPMAALEDLRAEPTLDRREVPTAPRGETLRVASPAPTAMRATLLMRARITLLMRVRITLLMPPTATSMNVLRKATPPSAYASGKTAGPSTPSTIAALR
jgi:hypothetical protein